MDLSSEDLKAINEQVCEAVRERGLPYEKIQVRESIEHGYVEFLAVVASDPMLANSGNVEARNIDALVRTFVISDDEKEVIWGQLTYSVDKGSSNFFPVPEGYGDRVTVEYGWEFDISTNRVHGPAQVRDLDRQHYVSVMPNPDFVSFVDTCEKVIEEWT